MGILNLILEEVNSDGLTFIKKEPLYFDFGISTMSKNSQIGWNYIYDYNGYKIVKAEPSPQWSNKHRFKLYISNFKNEFESGNFHVEFQTNLDLNQIQREIEKTETNLKNKLFQVLNNTDTSKLVNFIKGKSEAFGYFVKDYITKGQAANAGEGFILTIANFFTEVRTPDFPILKIALSKGYQFTTYKDFKNLLYKK